MTSHEMNLHPVVEALCDGASELMSSHGGHGRWVLPSRDAVIGMMEDVRAVFFPGYFGGADLHDDRLHYFVGATLDRVVRTLEEQVTRGLAFTERHPLEECTHCRARAREVASLFVQRLPEVRRLCASDVDAAYVGDPALYSPDEAIFSYPGIYAVTNQRVAHELFTLGVPLIPRMITEHAHSVTGIDIHPGARIGERFFIDHGTGVVIGETSVIGKGVRVYQGVTLGAKAFPLDAQGKPIKGIDRHPIVEDDVVIYAGATVLGRITLGKGSSVGGNVWLTQSIPAGSRVAQAAARDAAFEEGGGI